MSRIRHFVGSHYLSKTKHGRTLPFSCRSRVKNVEMRSTSLGVCLSADWQMSAAGWITDKFVAQLMPALYLLFPDSLFHAGFHLHPLWSRYSVALPQPAMHTIGGTSVCLWEAVIYLCQGTATRNTAFPEPRRKTVVPTLLLSLETWINEWNLVTHVGFRNHSSCCQSISVVLNREHFSLVWHLLS